LRPAARRLTLGGNVARSVVPYAVGSVPVIGSIALDVDPGQQFPIRSPVVQRRGLSYEAVSWFDGISANNDARSAIKY